MIQSYKKNPKLQSNYDSIIIGSGIGGLSTAAILAKQGQKVLVLERHYTAGGFTHIFKRKGFEWDVGIHYIGEMQRPESLMRKLFDYITDDALQWEDMGEVYDKISIGDKTYNLVKGVQNFKDQMYIYFPEEKKAIDAYVDLVFKATKAGRNFFMDKAIPPLFSFLFGWIMRKPLYKYSDKTTFEVLNSLTNNPELIKVLSGQYGDYGLPPKQGSFYMHATVVRHYFDGGSFPVGGSSKIVETISQVIAKAGGTILINAEVEKIIIEKDKAIGVKMADGKTIYAKKIISSTGIFNTYNKLIPPEINTKYKLNFQLQNINPSVAHVCLYLGLDGSPEDLKLKKPNLWIYPKNKDHDTCVADYLKNIDKDFPVVYVSFPSAKDPDWTNRYPNKSTIDIITLVPYEIFAPWSGSKWMHRGDEYTALKDKITTRLLEVLYRHVPQVKGKIIHQELSSPLTTQHFVNYEKGEIYGIDHSPKRFRQKFLKPRTPIKNFYLTGQDIVTAGVGGAMLSGVITSTAITGKNVIKTIMK